MGVQGWDIFVGTVYKRPSSHTYEPPVGLIVAGSLKHIRFASRACALIEFSRRCI